MELKDFVRESLSQIVGGVVEAQQELLNSGVTGEISPSIKTEWGKTDLVIGQSGMPIQNVEFDIAVIASEKTGTKGTIGVGIPVFKIGAGGETTETTSQTSRLKFSVPVALPPMQHKA